MNKRSILLGFLFAAIVIAQTNSYINGGFTTAGPINYCTDSGIGNTYTCTESTGKLTAYAAGMEFSFRATHTNTAAATFNLNSIGPVSIYKVTSAGLVPIVAGDIQSTGEAVMKYDGNEFELLNPATSASSSIGPTLAANPGNGVDLYWSACAGNTSTGNCPTPPASSGTWVWNSSLTSGWGMLQLNNSSNGPAAIEFSDRASAFGNDTTTHANGLWLVGENSLYGHTSVGGAVVTGTHNFFFESAGTDVPQKTTLLLKAATGQTLAPWGFALGTAQSGDTTFQNDQSYANIDSSGAGIVNIGDGTLGHHNATVNTGTVNAATANLTNLTVTNCTGCGSGSSSGQFTHGNYMGGVSCSGANNPIILDTVNIPANTLAIGSLVDVNTEIHSHGSVNNGNGSQFVSIHFGANGFYPNANYVSFQIPTSDNAYSTQNEKIFVTGTASQTAWGYYQFLSGDGTQPIRYSAPQSQSQGSFGDIGTPAEDITSVIPVQLQLWGCAGQTLGGSVDVSWNLHVSK